MKDKRTFWLQFLYMAVFIVSAGLRIGLALVNREANDNHMQVVQMLLKENRLPVRKDCWECFQPKLYYALVAAITQAAGKTALQDMIVSAQLLNALIGIMLVVLAWFFIQSLPVEHEHLKLSTFTLTALNPNLIGINGQATNDTVAILLSMLAIYFAMLFLKKEKLVYVLVCIILTALGLAAKTNVAITAGAIFAALLVKTFINRQKFMLLATAAFLFGIVALAFLNPLAQYWTNYQKYGVMVTINKGITRAPFPAFFQQSLYRHPGIISIQDGFFTFKYLSLLEYPRLRTEVTDYPAHRTSLWTQIYAHANSLHFDNWPSTWRSTGDQYFTLTRAIFILALLPTFLLIFGAALQLTRFLVALPKKSPALIDLDYGLFIIAFIGYFAFIALYALLYRDFTFMKAIFLYPALLSFIAAFVEGARKFEQNKWFIMVLSIGSAALACLYVADVITMTIHLYSLL